MANRLDSCLDVSMMVLDTTMFCETQNSASTPLFILTRSSSVLLFSYLELSAKIRLHSVGETKNALTVSTAEGEDTTP